MKFAMKALMVFLTGFILGARAEYRLHKVMGCPLDENELVKRIAGGTPAPPVKEGEK